MMGEASTKREADQRTADIRRYIDSLTPFQRIALQGALARRRNAEGNLPLDLDALKGIVEELPDAPTSAEEEQALAQAFSPKLGARCPCGQPASHRVELAVWGKREFKAIHRPAIVPVGGLFMCEPHAKAFEPSPELRQMVDEQMDGLKVPRRDWTSLQVVPIRLELVAKAADLFEAPPEQAICTETGCGQMASHRPQVTVWAQGAETREAFNCLQFGVDIGCCEAHATSFLEDGIDGAFRKTFDDMVKSAGRRAIDWTSAVCEPVPIRPAGRPN